MSSSANSSVTKRRGEADRGRGIPRWCRCGEKAIVRTSETYHNPGRLFYCCPGGSREDNTHLFKWTDIAMVEEIEEIHSILEKLQCDIAELSVVGNRCEKELQKIKVAGKIFKAIAFCISAMVLVVCYTLA